MRPAATGPAGRGSGSPSTGGSLKVPLKGLPSFMNDVIEPIDVVEFGRLHGVLDQLERAEPGLAPLVPLGVSLGQVPPLEGALREFHLEPDAGGPLRAFRAAARLDVLDDLEVPAGVVAPVRGQADRRALAPGRRPGTAPSSPSPWGR